MDCRVGALLGDRVLRLAGYALKGCSILTPHLEQYQAGSPSRTPQVGRCLAEILSPSILQVLWVQESGIPETSTIMLFTEVTLCFLFTLSLEVLTGLSSTSLGY